MKVNNTFKDIAQTFQIFSTMLIFWIVFMMYGITTDIRSTVGELKAILKDHAVEIATKGADHIVDEYSIQAKDITKIAVR